MHAYRKHLKKCKRKGGARIDALLESLPKPLDSKHKQIHNETA